MMFWDHIFSTFGHISSQTKMVFYEFLNLIRLNLEFRRERESLESEKQKLVIDEKVLVIRLRPSVAGFKEVGVNLQ